MKIKIFRFVVLHRLEKKNPMAKDFKEHRNISKTHSMFMQPFVNDSCSEIASLRVVEREAESEYIHDIFHIHREYMRARR